MSAPASCAARVAKVHLGGAAQRRAASPRGCRGGVQVARAPISGAMRSPIRLGPSNLQSCVQELESSVPHSWRTVAATRSATPAGNGPSELPVR